MSKRKSVSNHWASAVAVVCAIHAVGFASAVADSLVLEPLGASVDLKAAIQAAVSNNLELKKLELGTESSNSNEFEALSEHLPKLALRGTHYLGAKYSAITIKQSNSQMPSAYPQSTLDFEASILLFDGLSSLNRYRAATAETEAAMLELKYAKFRIEKAVQIKFYQALAAQEFSKVTEQNIETLEQHLKLIRVSQTAGFSTKVDVLRIESQLEEARAERMLAADQVAVARLALFEIMGSEGETRPLAGSLPVPDQKKFSEKFSFSLASALASRDDLKALSLREKASDRLAAAATGGWYPRISLFGIEQLYKYGDFSDAILANDSFQTAHSFGLRLNWSLFDGAVLAKQARAANQVKQVALGLKAQEVRSEIEFETFKRQYLTNAALVIARNRSIQRSEESVRLATEAVKAGTKTHSEVLDAELELFRARAGVVKAQADAAFALANLELAVGHGL